MDNDEKNRYINIGLGILALVIVWAVWSGTRNINDGVEQNKQAEQFYNEGGAIYIDANGMKLLQVK